MAQKLAMMRPPIKLRLRGAAAALLLCGTPQLSAGQQIPATPLRYRIGWQDVAVTGGSIVLTAIPTLLASRLTHVTCLPCDPYCLTCTGSDRRQCTACNGGKVIGIDKLCATACTTDAYLQNSTHCATCFPACKTCTGPSMYECATCHTSRLLDLKGSCGPTCAPGGYKSNDTHCAACH